MRGLLIFLYRIVYIMISVTKQVEAAEVNVCRGGLQNDNALQNFESFTGQWRLLSAWSAKAAFITKNWVATQLIELKRSAHFVQRNWHQSPHDLQTELNVVPGHWFSPKKVVILWVRALTIRDKAFGYCCCCCWWPHGVLICNSWFLKSNNRHQSETLHSNVTLFRLF